MTTTYEINKLNRRCTINSNQMKCLLEVLKKNNGEALVLSTHDDETPRFVYFGFAFGKCGVFAEMCGNTIIHLHAVKYNTTVVDGEWFYCYYIGADKYLIPESNTL